MKNGKLILISEERLIALRKFKVNNNMKSYDEAIKELMVFWGHWSI